MAEIKKYSLVEKLRNADKSLTGSPSLLGMTSLTYPNYINSMRSTMFTSHLNQFMNLLEPETPYVFTNNERLVGKYSSGYYKTKNTVKVFRKIAKFDDIVDEPRVYKMFIFDTVTETYDVIERKFCEDLTENFGFDYINDVIDSFKEGDIIDADTVMYHSTSYDEDMNYGYGKNVTVAYTLDPFTSEDAAIASRSLSKALSTIESEYVKIGLNSNDFFINLYGGKNEYKVLPDIGEKVSNKIAVVRRQFNNQLLFDFKDSTLREIHESDLIYYIEDDVEIVDITIYDNNDERIDTPFYSQINKYLDSQNRYYEDIVDTCEEIINSGYKYTGDVDYLYKRAKEMLDKDKKWREGDTSFNNMEIELQIRRISPLTKACKITGRYGNKSVIAEVWDDNKMPYTKDGRRVDLLLNLLALVNRTTSFPLYEILISGSAYQIRRKMATLDSLEEKENMLFDFINILNEEQCSAMYDNYKKLDRKGREAYIQEAIDQGIYIHQTPMWEKMPIFYRCQNVLKRFPFIQKDDLYIRKWGREHKVLTKYFIGDMYILRLKQSDRRGFSARSTGALDTKSLPTRSYKSRSHLEPRSSSCIRFGEFESLNFSIALVPEDIALFHALYRTSIKGRKDIISVMFGDENAIHKIDSSYTSRVSEIFNVILKSLGIKLDFVDEENEIKVLNDDIIKQQNIDGQVYMCTDYQAFLLNRAAEIRNIILEEHPILTDEQLKIMIEEFMKKNKYINGELSDEIGDLEIRLKKELDESYEKLKAKQLAKESEEIAETLTEISE